MSTYRNLLRGSETYPGVLDIAFAVLLPLLCFVLNPILTHGSLSFDRGTILSEASSFGLYAAVSMSVVFFLLSYVVPRWRLVAGGLLTGFVLSLIIGVALLPLSMLGLLLFGIGLLGLIPFVTSSRFFLRLRTILTLNGLRPRDIGPYLPGVLVVLLPAVATYHIAARENETLFAALRTATPSEFPARLSNLLESWTCSDSCQVKILYMVLREEVPMTNAEFETRISTFLGREYRVYVDCYECVVEGSGD